MTDLSLTLKTMTDFLPPSLEQAEQLAHQLRQLSHMAVYPRSVIGRSGRLYFLGRTGQTKKLGILAYNDPGFTGDITQISVNGETLNYILAPLTADNAALLRRKMPFLQAQTLGLQKSAGCGDRLGLATPGHIRAIRTSRMVPILAQQSIRENARTGRTPQQVMDDAMWGVLQEGWLDGFGADADHLKTTQDIELCAAAGYSFYTIDPGAYVDDAANTASFKEVQHKARQLPWLILDSSPDDVRTRLANTPIDLGSFSVTLTDEEVLRAVAKYGRAVAHTVSMYRHLSDIMGDNPFELEMSVDETNTVTSLAEHIYIATELQRLKVQWISLAPRYVGMFEKGVDYIGDVNAFRESFAQHIAVARRYGPYKLSLHSGSDKFRIYPIAAELAGDLVHLKTAGTSYLEALRTIASLDALLFRQIVEFAIERYPTDRATYHVSAEVERMPDISMMVDADMTTLLDDFHAREILHVTFGSVITHPPFREPFFDTLRDNETVYYQTLQTHFNKHFRPFYG